MNVWTHAYDAWSEIERGKINLTTDQKIAQAQTLALLAIGQELSGIHHQGINPEYDSSGD